jgi:serine/threonine-protein kinase
VPVSPAAGPLDPVELANAGTTILPWSAETDALPLSRTRNRARRAMSRRRRVEAGVAAAGLMAVTAAMWGFTSRTPASGGQDPTTEARMGLPQAATCEVAYTLRADSGNDFAAELALTNTGNRELRDWTMSFSFPGQQTVTRAEPAPVRQEGRTVLVRPVAERATLAPGATEKLTLAGKYSGANPLPVEFRLGGETCGVRVSGVAGSVPSTVPPSRATTPKAPTKATTARSGSGSGGSGVSGGGGAKAKPEKPSKGKGSGGSGKAGK